MYILVNQSRVDDDRISSSSTEDSIRGSQVSSVATNSSLRNSHTKKPVYLSTDNRNQGMIEIFLRSVVDGSILGKPAGQKEQPPLAMTVESSDEENAGAIGFDEPCSRSQSIEFNQAGPFRSP